MLHRQISKFFIFTIVLILSIVFRVSAITISPVRVELRGDPGTTVGADMTIINDQSETKTYYVSYENFEAQGDSGVPKFVGGSEGLATWLRAPTSVVIPAGESKVIPYTIAIPSDARAGGYFSAIFWSTTPPASNEGGNVSIGAKVGMLVLLTVNGDIAESAGLQEFQLEKRTHFYTARPVDFSYNFTNTGGDRVQPKGEVVVRNIFGWVAGRINANPSQGNVLPNTQRVFHVAWDSDSSTEKGNGFFDQVKYEWQHFAAGVYRAQVSITYGTQGQEVKSPHLYFVVFPWHLILVIVLPLILLWVGVRKAMRTYKKRLLQEIQEQLAK